MKHVTQAWDNQAIMIPRPWWSLQGWAVPMTFSDTFVGTAGIKIEVFPVNFDPVSWISGSHLVTTRNSRLKPIQCRQSRGRKNQVLVTLLRSWIQLCLKPDLPLNFQILLLFFFKWIWVEPSVPWHPRSSDCIGSVQLAGRGWEQVGQD